MRNAAASGDPNSVLTAAKLPVAATTEATPAGTFPRRARRTASTASPPPRAINGASGPTTTPSPMLASAAAAIPPSSRPAGNPPAWKPSAGDSPPWPGRYRVTGATTTPATPSGMSGHHNGGAVYPSASGAVVNAQVWSAAVSRRNP